jgi:hypothetical protein
MGYKSLLETQTISVIQPAVEYFDDMEWKAGVPPDPFDIKVNLQPFKYQQRRWQPPEGYRIEDIVVVYSRGYQLRNSDVHTKRTSDRFVYKNLLYEVILEQDWHEYGMRSDHYACLAVKKEPDRAPLEDIT